MEGGGGGGYNRDFTVLMLSFGFESNPELHWFRLVLLHYAL